jgi:hypothetical protein
MSVNRFAAAALAAIGAASAIPIALAQLDFAGLVNAFDIDNGDTPRGVIAMVGVGGFLTIAVIALAFVGAGLAFSGAPSARTLILAAAIAGLVTAFPFWIPAGVLLAVAALVLGEPIELPTAATGMGTSSTRQMYTHRYADKG